MGPTDILSGFAALLADGGWGDHMGWNGGWWIVMAIGMVLFWGLVIFGVVWLVRELSGARGQEKSEPGALAILDRRFADGTISTEEYRERRAVLTEAPPPPKT
jgi:putative membrane protein